MNGQHNKKEGILFRHLLLSFVSIRRTKKGAKKPQ